MCKLLIANKHQYSQESNTAISDRRLHAQIIIRRYQRM